MSASRNSRATAEDAFPEWEQGVAAGTRVLGGAEALDGYAGHCWGMLKTRPYMRARLGLAQCLWSLRRQEEAVGHCRELLRLNPNDNQGVRYVLSSYLCELGRDDQWQQLLAQYPDDASAEWHFGRALLAYRRAGGHGRFTRSAAGGARGQPVRRRVPAGKSSCCRRNRPVRVTGRR